MPKLARVFIVCAALACSCSDSSTATHTFVIRGKVTTGAHARTPLASGYLGVLGPQGANAGHWIRYSSSPGGLPAETTSDGSYQYTVEVSTVTTTSKGFPFFVAVSDAAQTLTMLSEIPQDLVVAGAELTIDINPTTTVASLMICPGGAFPPPANTWCHSDPKTASANNTGMTGILDTALAGTLISLETGSPPAWSTFASGFLSDPPTFNAIRDNLTRQGITLEPAATPASILSAIAALPLVHPLTASTDPPTSGGGCKLVWDCGASSQCATVYGGKSGNAAEPDAATCASVCKSQGACTCQGC